jgi:hypothetical protein
MLVETGVFPVFAQVNSDLDLSDYSNPRVSSVAASSTRVFAAGLGTRRNPDSKHRECVSLAVLDRDEFCRVFMKRPKDVEGA